MKKKTDNKRIFKSKYGQHARMCKYCGLRGKQTPGDFCDAECERLFHRFKDMREKNKGKSQGSSFGFGARRSNCAKTTQLNYEYNT